MHTTIETEPADLACLPFYRYTEAGLAELGADIEATGQFRCFAGTTYGYLLLPYQGDPRGGWVTPDGQSGTRTRILQEAGVTTPVLSRRAPRRYLEPVPEVAPEPAPYIDRHPLYEVVEAVGDMPRSLIGLFFRGENVSGTGNIALLAYHPDAPSMFYPPRTLARRQECFGPDEPTDGPGRMWFAQPRAVRMVAEGTPAPEPAPEPEPEVEVEKMSKKQLRDALAAATAAHVADAAKISARLEQQATRRDWCSEYDDVIKDLSTTLTVPLTARKVKVTLRYHGVYSAPYDLAVDHDEGASEEDIEAAILATVKTALTRHATAVTRN